MKIWTSEHIFHHPWEQVTTAAWRKYPNPMNPSVLAIDVLDRQLEGGILKTQRLLASTWGLPGWVKSIIGEPTVMYANERSEVDVNQRTMTLKTRNVTFCNFIAVDETVWYEPNPEAPESQTRLRQEATVLVQGVPLGSYMENMLTATISSNAQKGRLAMEWVIKKINDEIKDLSSALRNTDDLINSTKKSIDVMANSAKTTVDGVATAAKKSLDDFQIAASKGSSKLEELKLPPPPPLPKL